MRLLKHDSLLRHQIRSIHSSRFRERGLFGFRLSSMRRRSSRQPLRDGQRAGHVAFHLPRFGRRSGGATAMSPINARNLTHGRLLPIQRRISGQNHQSTAILFNLVKRALFFDASTHLYRRVFPAICWSVNPSVRWYFRLFWT